MKKWLKKTWKRIKKNLAMLMDWKVWVGIVTLSVMSVIAMIIGGMFFAFLGHLPSLFVGSLITFSIAIIFGVLVFRKKK